MTIEERVLGIDASEPTGEWKSITYRNEKRPRPVKSIPLRYLLYNPHNGRIRSLTKSYEEQFNVLLDPADPDDKLLIEQYLYDSAKGRNDKTKESLETKGQQEVGIVTRDGIIIDGNRRAMLLNMISGGEGNFNAIVLEDDLLANKKEIVTLETSYQMGVDSKVDYNPIEKYIRCKELSNDYQYSPKDISEIMAEDESKIIEWLNILSIMDEYLIFLGTPGVYTRLEKREGHFVDLNNYLRSYHSGRANTDWHYGDDDITVMKKAYFTYVRLGVPVVRTRVISRPTVSGSFFAYQDIWKRFVGDLNKISGSIEEENIEQLKSEEAPSVEDAIRVADDKWKMKAEDPLLEVLSQGENLIQDKFEINKPIRILRRVYNSLGQVSVEYLLLGDTEECGRLLADILERAGTLSNALSQK